MMSAGYVYVIDPGVEINGRRVVKIGRTTRSPWKRLKELQTAFPHKIALVHCAQFPNVAAAEKYLHTKLDQFRVKDGGGSEFFSLTPSEAVALINTFAHQTSAYEAKRALERELEDFLERVSGNLPFKLVKVALLATFIICLIYYARQYPTLGMALLASAGAWLMVAFFVGMAASLIGHALAKSIWRDDIRAERARLIVERYPAAAPLSGDKA
jgi:hypothetical protein